MDIVRYVNTTTSRTLRLFRAMTLPPLNDVPHSKTNEHTMNNSKAVLNYFTAIRYKSTNPQRQSPILNPTHCPMNSETCTSTHSQRPRNPAATHQHPLQPPTRRKPLTAINTQQRLTYGLSLSPILAPFQNIPKTLQSPSVSH